MKFELPSIIKALDCQLRVCFVPGSLPPPAGWMSSKMGAFYRPAWTSRIVLSTLHRERVMMPLGQAKLELSDRCGHYPQWEQPDAFVDLGTS